MTSTVADTSCCPEIIGVEAPGTPPSNANALFTGIGGGEAMFNGS
jgi:hypothetical protein